MANIKSLKQCKKWPWTPESKALLDACYTCGKLKGPKREGGFSEQEFIDSMAKMKHSGWPISQRQLNTLKKIHRLRVLGRPIVYKQQDIGRLKYKHD